MKDLHCIAQASEDKKTSSKFFILLFDAILKDASLSLNDLSFIVANQGPAPFTSLRVALAAVNGIYTATHIPLIGVDGLITLLKQHTSWNTQPTVVLLNAYNNEVYYAYFASHQIKAGYSSLSTLLKDIRTIFSNQNIRFSGEGSRLYSQKIIEELHEQAEILDETHDYTSLDALAREGYRVWTNEKKGSGYLLPLYLKKSL